MRGFTAKTLLQDVPSASADSDGTSDGVRVRARGVVNGPGNIVVGARATSVNITQAREDFAAAVANAISTDVPRISDLNDIFRIVDEIVPPYAQAIANAFTDATSVQVTATGEDATACGQASTSPRAAARRAAQALVEVCLSSLDADGPMH